jgi:hypothetical protein
MQRVHDTTHPHHLVFRQLLLRLVFFLSPLIGRSFRLLRDMSFILQIHCLLLVNRLSNDNSMETITIAYEMMFNFYDETAITIDTQSTNA